MNRAAFASAFAAALVLGLAFRLAAPSVRPMHHDEANQAVRFGGLLETGEYVYDRTDHHGPTLYYVTLPFAWARGQHTLASLDEQTLRLVPAVFGVATILLFLFLWRALGPGAVASAAILAAISPALTYYSRFYIQEPLFVFFILAFLIALGRYVLRPHPAAALWAGLFAGLAYATKETSLIALPAAVVACALARAALAGAPRRSCEPAQASGEAAAAGLPRRSGEPAQASGEAAKAGLSSVTACLHVLAALIVALLVALLLFSSFFRNPSGLIESVRAFSIYFDRGLAPGGHGEPWSYYLRILAWATDGGLVWTEGLVLALALVGALYAVAVRRVHFWAFYLFLYTALTSVAFSALRYKTPWNLLPFYIGVVLLAGVGTRALFTRTKSRTARAVLAVVLATAAVQLVGQTWRSNFRFGADSRNPYAYVHTSPDFVRLAARVHDLAVLHPDGRRLLVEVVAGPYEQWPFPWYARDLSRVGYWTSASAAGRPATPPIVVASQDNTAALDAALGDRYVTEFYGLRPGVLLTLYVERGLWERFLDSRR